MRHVVPKNTEKKEGTRFLKSIKINRAILNEICNFNLFFRCLPLCGTTDTEIKATSTENPGLSINHSEKPGVGHNIALHVPLAASNSTFLNSIY